MAALRWVVPFGPAKVPAPFFGVTCAGAVACARKHRRVVIFPLSSRAPGPPFPRARLGARDPSPIPAPPLADLGVRFGIVQGTPGFLLPCPGERVFCHTPGNARSVDYRVWYPGSPRSPHLRVQLLIGPFSCK